MVTRVSPVENIELRQRLQEMTESGAEPSNHHDLLAAISREFPNTIRPLDSGLPENRYTCGMYVFDFSDNSDYVKIAGRRPHVLQLVASSRSIAGDREGRRGSGPNSVSASPFARHYGRAKMTSVDEAGGVLQNGAVAPDVTATYCFPLTA